LGYHEFRPYAIDAGDEDWGAEALEPGVVKSAKCTNIAENARFVRGSHSLSDPVDEPVAFFNADAGLLVGECQS
jgi:hypothetical protein